MGWYVCLVVCACFAAFIIARIKILLSPPSYYFKRLAGLRGDGAAGGLAANEGAD
jgi:hypothetical protein